MFPQTDQVFFYFNKQQNQFNANERVISLVLLLLLLYCNQVPLDESEASADKMRVIGCLLHCLQSITNFKLVNDSKQRVIEYKRSHLNKVPSYILFTILSTIAEETAIVSCDENIVRASSVLEERLIFIG